MTKLEEKLKIENMRPGEEVLKVVKRHWIVFVMLGLYFLLGLIITIIIYWIFGFGVWGNLINIVIWLFFSLFLFVEWLNHELDMYVITNNRIIGIEQIAFLNRAVSECNLGQIQEVNSKTSGLLANIFNYGVLSIQTAGNKTTLKMTFCPNAIQTSRKILNIVDNYRDEKNIKENKEF
ncbi:PH domain-containing protein [Candidatus Gracilibacteria bacterium]|nr:PH domain-containing protein [Candidatus Gracilibacteria bacterium]